MVVPFYSLGLYRNGKFLTLFRELGRTPWALNCCWWTAYCHNSVSFEVRHWFCLKVYLFHPQFCPMKFDHEPIGMCFQVQSPGIYFPAYGRYLVSPGALGGVGVLLSEAGRTHFPFYPPYLHKILLSLKLRKTPFQQFILMSIGIWNK